MEHATDPHPVIRIPLYFQQTPQDPSDLGPAVLALKARAVCIALPMMLKFLVSHWKLSLAALTISLMLVMHYGIPLQLLHTEVPGKSM